MYNNGDVGAYDISFALHPGHSPCVDAVLNDMFEDVCVNTGRFSCNRGTFADVRDSKTQKRGSLKQVDEDQFRCNSIQDFDRVDSKVNICTRSLLVIMSPLLTGNRFKSEPHTMLVTAPKLRLVSSTGA